jgi:hypothetical protein
MVLPRVLREPSRRRMERFICSTWQEATGDAGELRQLGQHDSIRGGSYCLFLRARSL